MLLMLSSPILLFTIAHILFPPGREHVDLGEYYFARAKLIWSLAALTVIVSVGFRPLAFGMPLLVVDNASSLPSLLTCVLLAVINARKLHYVLVPLVPLTIALDTMVINYLID